MIRMLMAAAIACVAAVSSAGERVALWPEGKMPLAQDHQIGVMTDVSKKPGFVAAEHRMPTIEWSAPTGTNLTKACMIVASGGGYDCCCNYELVHEWVKAMTARGITCATLVYRTPRPKGLPFYATAWADGQRAVRLVRRDAGKRGFDPNRIGFMSISAGAHLATLLATSSLTSAYERADELDETPCNINWACAFAVAYTLTDGLGTANTKGGDGPDVKLDDIFKFDEMTCPMWLAHGGVDIVSPFASTKIYRELRKRKIPAEVHLFPDKDHRAWGFDRSLEFMTQMGYLGRPQPDVDLLKRYPSDDARAAHEKREIWPKGQVPDAHTNQCTPYLEWHLPKMLKTKAIQIIYSGGCYQDNSPDEHEVAPARRFLNERGVTVVTLKYRTPRPYGLPKHQTAWQDLQRTVRIVRHEAASRGLDPNRIGIMGSSAGGHLTLMGATSSTVPAYAPIDEIDREPCNVQWAIAIYPAYALTDGLDRGNTTGGNADSAVLAPEFAFDAKTPPILCIHGDKDGWASMNSVKVWEKLKRMGIQGGVHTLALRGHCFQFHAAPGTGSYTWLDRIWDFLQEKKLMK